MHLTRSRADVRPAWLDADLDAFAGPQVVLELVDSTGPNAYAFPRRIPAGVLVTFTDRNGLVTCSLVPPGQTGVEHGTLGHRVHSAFPFAADWPAVAVRLVSSLAGPKFVLVDDQPPRLRVMYFQRGLDETPRPLLGDVRVQSASG